MTSKESIALRLKSALLLVAALPPGSPEMARAAVTKATLENLEPLADKLDSAELNKRAAAVARARDVQRRFSAEWVKLDAEFDVLVAIEEDINPTTREEMGAGSNPHPEPAAA